MRTRQARSRILVWLTASVAGLLIGAAMSSADDAKKPSDHAAAKGGDDKKNAEEPASKPAGDLAEVEIKLPKPAFKGTPKDAPAGANLEKPRLGPRPPFMAPKGAKNVALNKPVTSSDPEPIVGKLKQVTDGDREASDGSFVELGPGLQWVQIDLKEPARIYGVLVWHYHANARVYHDVVVQVADDADFIKNVRTLFNNDHDNSSGLGLGEAKEFWDTFEGKLIEVNGVTARYIRLYSKGSTADDQNHYTEVEVYGLPAKD